MTQSADLLELREDEITAHYEAAVALLDGFDHTPRIAKAKETAAPERSPGIGTRRRFRTTTPGLVTRSTARAEGVHLIDRIEGIGDADPITTPTQATVLQALRRALAVAYTVQDHYTDATGLSELLKDNLQGSLAAAKRAEFGELLAAASLITLHTFANMCAYLTAPVAGEGSVEIGPLEEVLTDNPATALAGALWELDQDLGAFAQDDNQTVLVLRAFCEKLMEKVALRAASTPRLDPFTAVAYRVEADDFTVDGFSAASRAKSTQLTMSFKKPHQVVGNHIAKYQAMKLAKML
ncbi:MAG: AAA family ATPase, partial [Pseudomonadota bacterium]